MQMQIPVQLKSEANLQVSDNLTDHSDNASEVSDEGYRSLGIVQSGGDKGKNRSSLCSQNSAEDGDDNGNPPPYFNLFPHCLIAF